MIQVEAYIKFLVNVAKQCTLWERALKIRFRLDLWLSCLLTSDFYRWLWIRSYSFVKKGRENFLYKTETNSFHFFHFDKVESLSLSLLCTATQCLILAILGPMTRYYTDWKQNKIIQRVLMNSVLAYSVIKWFLTKNCQIEQCVSCTQYITQAQSRFQFPLKIREFIREQQFKLVGPQAVSKEKKKKS